MLNSQQIISEGLLKLDNTFGKQAQVGFDLSIKSISEITDNKIGFILKDKTILPEYETQNILELDGHTGWLLDIGVYDITFHEGCKLPTNRTAFIKQRSSLYRNGIIINSPLFDPGFETDNMGTFMFVSKKTFIEKDARVAQIYFHENEPAELYNGQFMGDKQRNK